MEVGNLPTQAVTRDEFIQQLVETGKSQGEAEMQATVCFLFNSEILVGGKLLRIKDEEHKEETCG